MERARHFAGMAADVVVGLRRPRRRSQGVLVLGMHRSGTSAITSVIGRLGPALGDHGDLMEPDGANQNGYWESRRLTEFQESLLQKLGGDWETPTALQPGWERDWRLVRRLGLGRRTFRDVYKGAEQWVWKDPRTALLLPFWRRALRFDPVVVGVFRNPLEVAESLAARDGMTKREALRLWEAYNRALLANARGLPAFMTSYEDLVDEPSAVARELSRFLETQGLTVRLPAEDVLQSCVDADLRHNVHSLSEAEAEDHLSAGQRELFRKLLEIRGGHSTFPDLRTRFEPRLESGRPA